MNIEDVSDKDFLKKLTSALINSTEPEIQKYYKDIDEDKCVIIGTLPNGIKHLHNLQTDLYNDTKLIAKAFKDTSGETEDSNQLLNLFNRLEDQFKAVHTCIYGYLRDIYIEILEEDKKIVILINWRVAYVKDISSVSDSENTLSHFNTLVRYLYSETLK